MTFRLLLAFALTFAAAARAAEPAGAEEAMVKQCRAELEERLFGTAAHGEAFITAQDIRHEPDRVVIRLDVASGEGRRVSGSCIFRDGKLFDVK
ncbi:MAG TPA: hypothetical protein VEI03_10600 [Stellaceae bacterium]|nr:hypothetical protein [Stellaceae bacterium]